MTELQKEFLRLHVILQKDYKTISKETGIAETILSQWYEDFKPERETIAKIRNTWSRKKFTPEFEDFYNWYFTLERRCTYCGITENEIEKLLAENKLTTKRVGSPYFSARVN